MFTEYNVTATPPPTPTSPISTDVFYAQLNQSYLSSMFLDSYQSDHLENSSQASLEIEYSPIHEPKDVGRALREMDRANLSQFSSYIKQEENLQLSIEKLTRIAQDYSLDQTVIAFRWLITEWRLKTIIKLVKDVTASWTDEVKLGSLVKQLSVKWRPEFIGELSWAILLRLNNANCAEDKQKQFVFLQTLFAGWTFNTISSTFLHLGDKIQWELKSRIFKWFQTGNEESYNIMPKSTLSKDSPVQDDSVIHQMRQKTLPPKPIITPVNTRAPRGMRTTCITSPVCQRLTMPPSISTLNKTDAI